MNKPHIAQIGGLFDLDSFDFLSSQNLLEYDFILIDGHSLMDEVNDAVFVNRTLSRVEELQHFIVQKNIPLVLYCTEKCSFSSEKFKDSQNFLDVLGMDVMIEAKKGMKIEANKDCSYHNFFEKYGRESEYFYSFIKHPGVSVGRPKHSSSSIGFYTKDFLILPDFKEDTDIDFDEYFRELYQLCKAIRKEDYELSLPDWAASYVIPHEKEIFTEITKIDSEMKQLLLKKEELESALASHLSIKSLWSATGSVLESSVKKVFDELGFESLRTDDNRDDLLLFWKDKKVVIEIKGVTKSAAEKNAAQLEKFLSMHLEKDGELPKGILVVNTFRDIPLSKRTEVSFPNQMLDYSTRRDHCLITTLQLCTLLLYIRENPDECESVVERLLNCTGRYDEFLNWGDYMIEQKKTMRQTKISK